MAAAGEDDSIKLREIDSRPHKVSDVWKDVRKTLLRYNQCIIHVNEMAQSSVQIFLIIKEIIDECKKWLNFLVEISNEVLEHGSLQVEVRQHRQDDCYRNLSNVRIIIFGTPNS